MTKKEQNIYEGDFPDILDMLYPWETRIQADLPFFKIILKRYKIRSILDAGCGNGLHLYLFKTLKVQKVVGIDNSITMIRKAKENLSKRGIKGVNILRADLRSLHKVLKEKFDLITCSFVLSSLASGKYKEIIKALAELNKILNENGLILIEDFNPDKVVSNKSVFEYVSTPRPSYQLMRRGKVVLEIHKQLQFPVLLKREKKAWIIKLFLPPLYEWLRNRNICIISLDLFDPYIIVKYFLFDIGFIRRFNLEIYRVVRHVLNKERLVRYLKEAGFSQVSIQKASQLSPYKDDNFSQIVIAQKQRSA